MNKHRHNRREFLGLTGAGVASFASGGLLSTTVFAEAEGADTDSRHADLVVFNAKIYTVDSRMPNGSSLLEAQQKPRPSSARGRGPLTLSR